MLPEERRLQLDGIVQQAEQNQETPENIQFIVNDFKTKYNVPEEQTLWVKAKEVAKEILIPKQFWQVEWAVKWGYKWLIEAPAIFWPEWWAAIMEEEWIRKQKEAGEIKTLTKRLTDLSEESILIQQKAQEWTATNEDLKRSREIKVEQEDARKQLPIRPWVLQEWIWALQEFSAPVAWPIWATFWKLFWWLIWTVKWTLTTEEQQAFWEVIQSAIETGQDVDKLWEEKLWTSWKVAKEAAWATFETVEPLLDIVWAWEVSKLLKWAFKPKVKDIAKEATETATKEEAKLIKELWQEKMTWVIDWVEFQIPKPKTTLLWKVTAPFKTDDTKLLAWKALTPSFAGKSPKQIVRTTKNIEKDTKQFWKDIRTWKLEWDISTLENAAETTVNNLDTVWKRLGNAIENVSWNVAISDDILKLADDALTNRIEARTPAFPVLKTFIEDMQDWLNVKDAFRAKVVYWNEITKLVKAWDAWTDSYKALVKWVEHINTTIDDIIETQLKDARYIEDKRLYRSLKTIVNDIVKSAAVEWRRSPNTFVEQMALVDSLVEWVTNPLSTARTVFAKEIWQINTRWWAWKELIDIYDRRAITDVKKWVKPVLPKPVEVKKPKTNLLDLATPTEKPFVEKIIKQTEWLKPKKWEVIIYNTWNSPWVDTNLEEAIKRWMNKTTTVKVIDKNKLIEASKDKTDLWIFKITQ